MNNKQAAFTLALQDSPVIAAVKNEDGLIRALESDCTVIFFLHGTILNISTLVARAKACGKFAFVHTDLIEGMSVKDISADFIARNTAADGVISTRPNLIRRAKELDLITIQRFSCWTRSLLTMCCGRAPMPMLWISCPERCRASSAGLSSRSNSP